MKVLTRYTRPRIGKELETVQSEIKQKKWDKPMVDKSYYVPTEEANATVNGNMSGKGAFDFKTGENHADFTKIAKLRKPGADIVEIERGVQELNEIAVESLNNDAINNIKKTVNDKNIERNILSETVKNQINSSVINSTKN